MLLIEVLVYVIVACIIVKYIYKLDGFTTIKLGCVIYIGWLLLCIMLL